jgi:hypothetical protein
LLPLLVYIKWKKICAFEGVLRFQGGCGAGWLCFNAWRWRHSGDTNIHTYIHIYIYTYMHTNIETLLMNSYILFFSFTNICGIREVE